MKLWKISQDVNSGWDTWDSAVVAALTADDARNTLPSEYADKNTWCDPELVKAELIGEAIEGIQAGVILASFNAG